MLVPGFSLNRLQQWDTRLFLWVTRRRHLARLTRFARNVSRSADGFAYPPLILALFLYDSAASTRVAILLTLGFLLERPIYFALKNALRRNRPAAALEGYRSVIVPSDRFSFPSGHTAAAFLVATTVLLAWPLAGSVFLCWALLVGMSRVVLGVHFPGDTLAGALIGGGFAVVLNALVVL